MELLERVREIGNDTAPLSEGAVNDARQLLLREIAREEHAGARHPVRRGRWIGGSALVGGAAALALVIGFVANPVSAPTAAAAILEEAAVTTLTTVALDPGPGQFIRIDDTFEQRYRGFAPEDGVEYDVDYTVTYPRVIYVPADRSDDWIADFPPMRVTITRGDAGLADQIATSIGVGQETALAGLARTEAYPGGRIMAGDGWKTHDFRLNSMARYYDEMPRDPQQLLDWIDAYPTVEGSSPPDLVDLYGFNLAPADLRATIFRALALQNGTSVLSVNGEITTIAYPESGEDHSRAVVTIDTKLGLIVGFGTEETDENGTTSVSDSYGRLAISIVDSAPQAVRIDG